MIRREEVSVTYCDECGAKMGYGSVSGQCFACGRDACPRHYHLVKTETRLTRSMGIPRADSDGLQSASEIKRRYTYLCSSCNEKMQAELDVVFKKYTQHKT